MKKQVGAKTRVQPLAARRPKLRPVVAIALSGLCVLIVGPAVHFVDWPSECESLVATQQRCFPGMPREQAMRPSQSNHLEGQELAAYCRQSRELLERSCR